jgi:hypothetical protein
MRSQPGIVLKGDLALKDSRCGTTRLSGAARVPCHDLASTHTLFKAEVSMQSCSRFVVSAKSRMCGRLRVGTICAICCAFAVIAFIATIARLAFGPVVPYHLLRNIEGATKDDVVRILGKPSDGGATRTWIYTRWPNQGWVGVTFDDSGRVSEVNDESVFGSE